MEVGDRGTLTINDRITGTVNITGTMIGRISTRDGAPGQVLDGPRTRWSVNTVIKLDDDRYVLTREAFSLVYHDNAPQARKPCRTVTGILKGEAATVDDLPDDAVPCWRCRPPGPVDLGDTEQIRYEFPKRSIDRCEDPAQVVRLLHVRKHGSGVRSMVLPEPARALIEQCIENDPDFAGAPMPATNIG